MAEELALALKQRKPIIPLVYRKTDIPAMLNAQLEGFQFLDFRKGGYAQNLADLVTALERHGVSLHAARELSQRNAPRGVVSVWVRRYKQSGARSSPRADRHVEWCHRIGNESANLVGHIR